jgi:hypothetical protein
MALFQVDDDGQLFISPALTDWEPVQASGIDTVIDMEGGLDSCIPRNAWGVSLRLLPHLR